MTLIPFSRACRIRPGNRPGNHWIRIAGVVALVLFLQGCAERRPHAAIPWATMTAVRPRIPVLAPGYVSPSLDEDAPDLRWEGAPPALNLVVTKPPARPHTSSAAPVPETNASSKPDPLSLVPQLSAQEVAAAQQQMNESISGAQNRLSAAKVRHLNATQTDLVSKINSFIAESQEAARGGDWNRAKNLAKKAQVLGEELAGSL